MAAVAGIDLDLLIKAVFPFIRSGFLRVEGSLIAVLLARTAAQH